MSSETDRVALARRLVSAWERQQEVYIPLREVRFELILDLVARLAPAGPRVLDLACGPGSVSARVLDRFPDAEVVAVDLDPLLLALGRLDRSGRARGPVWVHADLRDPGWTDRLPVTCFDAIVSTTALHWLTGGQLSELYQRLHSLLRPGGVFLNGDYLPPSRPWGTIAATMREIGEARQEVAVAAGADDWETWWSRVRATPELAEEVRAHDETFADKLAHEAPSREFHLEALRDCGFADVELVWHDLTEGLICAVRGSAGDGADSAGRRTTSGS
ncbi:MAG: trans-aconitate 2-methyltransferase [Pseudonocardia sp.]